MTGTATPSHGPAGGRSVEIMLGADSGSPRRARRFVVDSLRRMGMQHHVDTAALLVSELVTNALVHARGEIVARVTTQAGGLRIEVRDTSEVAPVPRARNVDSETGRGMLLVSELADEWGANPGPQGKVVWFELRDGPPSRTPGAPDVAGADPLDRDPSASPPALLGQRPPTAGGRREDRDGLTWLRDRAVAATGVSFTISDPHQQDNPLVWVNPAFSRLTGYEFAETVGRNCRFLQGPGTDPAAVREMREAQAQQRPTKVTLLNYRKDGTAFFNELSLSPAFDAAGELTHFVGVQADVTVRVQAERERKVAHDAERVARAESERARDAAERAQAEAERIRAEAERARAEAEQARAAAEAAQRQLRLFAEATTRLSATLDVDTAVEQLAKLAVPDLADWCAVHVVDHAGTPQRPGAQGVTLRAECPPGAGTPPGRPSRPAPVPPAVAQVLRDGRAVLLPDLGDDLSAILAEPQAHGDPRVRDSRSAMVLPLQARNQMLGAVTLVVTAASGRRYGAEELDLVGDLVRRAGLAVDNARLYTREHTVAEALQRSLLPALPRVEGADVAARYLAASVGAEVGGDWYDVLLLPDGAVGLAVGDVMGHDLAAAASMGQLRSVLRSYAWEGDPAALVLDRLDRLVQGLGMAQLATAIYARLEPGGTDGMRLLHYANAGHLPPLLQRPDGTCLYLSGGQSVLLGAPAQGERPEAVEPLASGSTLLLYTDGLVERRGVDLDRGLALLRSTAAAVEADAGPEALCDRVLADLVGDRLADDVALLALRLR